MVHGGEEGGDKDKGEHKELNSAGLDLQSLLKIFFKKVLSRDEMI